MLDPATGHFVTTAAEKARVFASQCAATEVGQPMDPLALLEQALARQRAQMHGMRPPRPEDLLTVDMLTAAIRRGRSGRGQAGGGQISRPLRFPLALP